MAFPEFQVEYSPLRYSVTHVTPSPAIPIIIITDIRYVNTNPDNEPLDETLTEDGEIEDPDTVELDDSEMSDSDYSDDGPGESTKDSAVPSSVASRWFARLLYVASGILAIVAVATLVTPLFSPEVAATLNLRPEISEQLLETSGSAITLSPTGSDGLTLNVFAQADNVQNAKAMQLLSGVGTTLWALALAGIAFLFGRLLSHIANNHPFERNQPRRFYLIGAFTLLASGGADLINFAYSKAFLDSVRLESGEPLSETFTAHTYLGFVPLALAGVAFILGKAFQVGQDLERDTEGLV